jgi:hypothetical protein
MHSRAFIHQKEHKEINKKIKKQQHTGDYESFCVCKVYTQLNLFNKSDNKASHHFLQLHGVLQMIFIVKFS